jgi:hypothetical protein
MLEDEEVGRDGWMEVYQLRVQLFLKQVGDERTEQFLYMFE